MGRDLQTGTEKKEARWQELNLNLTEDQQQEKVLKDFTFLSKREKAVNFS